jgi:2-keto-4-pentenoate hydratase
MPHTAITPASASLSPLAQTIAREIVQAHRTGVVWQPEAFDAALTVDEAYRIQAAVARELGWFLDGRAAWKVGGIAPNISGSPLPVVLPSGAVWPAANAHGLTMEAEIAVRLTRTPTSADEVLDCIGEVCASIELVSTRLADGLNAPTAWKIADQQVHAVLVAGAAEPFAQIDWTAQSLTVDINGDRAAQGTGTAANGNPLSTLPWLFAQAQRAGLPLKAGDLITTGAWAVIPIATGDHIRVVFDGLAPVEVTCGNTADSIAPPRPIR